jgi:hypothetical protein
MYGVGVTNVPAFVEIFPLKLFMPPVAIAEPVAGEKSKPLAPVGTDPVAGIATNNGAASPVLRVSELPAASSENCDAGVAVLAWNSSGVSAK